MNSNYDRGQDVERNTSCVPYIFDNVSDQASPRFRALESIFDPGTKRIIAELGAKPGWFCFEVGAGGGNIAAWLCDQVGPDGHVVATDIDTRHLQRLNHCNLTIRRHDIAEDVLPEGLFDLIHTRLVLIHLPEREQIMRRLIDVLKPGGWLLLEEFDSLSLRSDPGANPAEDEFATLKAMYHVMSERGVELRCGRLLDGRLRQLGLENVGSEGRIFMWRGGSPGADLMRANILQLRRRILASGHVSESQVEHDLAQLDRDDFTFPSPILWAAWGRRSE
jgi:ubiquinone/menaquinone biosynthesis C-methylase UbiE